MWHNSLAVHGNKFAKPKRFKKAFSPLKTNVFISTILKCFFENYPKIRIQPWEWPKYQTFPAFVGSFTAWEIVTLKLWSELGTQLHLLSPQCSTYLLSTSALWAILSYLDEFQLQSLKPESTCLHMCHCLSVPNSPSNRLLFQNHYNLRKTACFHLPIQHVLPSSSSQRL